MESKGNYTPEEVARMIALHSATELSVIQLEGATNQMIDTARSQRGEQSAYVHRHTLSSRAHRIVWGLKTAYETEIPEDVRKSLESSGLLPRLFELQIDKKLNNFLEPSETT